jgi:glycosyltransferase involved in cell wall biosynthesis
MTTTRDLTGETRFLIGIDASRSVSAQPTGTELYSRYLIEALLDHAPERFSFRLYFNQPPSVVRSQKSEVRVISFPRLWTHLRLSTEMMLHRPDLLFIPAHVLPLVHPRRSIVTVHDLGYLYFPEAHPPRQRWYLDRSTRWHARTAAHLLADSAATKRDLIEKYHANPDRITVAYPGLDPAIKRIDNPNEVARVKANYNIDGDYLLYLGTIQPRKNLQRLITAFTSCNFHPALVLAGKQGWYADESLKQANDRVHFIGYVDAIDKNALLSGATAFVFPSLYEGFGFPVLEALACGVPVLCSNTSSLPEVAGDAAVLVNPLEVDSIARGLSDLMSNAELRRTLIERSHSQAQKFTWQACADSVLGVFEEVLQSDKKKGEREDGKPQ